MLAGYTEERSLLFWRAYAAELNLAVSRLEVLFTNLYDWLSFWPM